VKEHLKIIAQVALGEHAFSLLTKPSWKERLVLAAIVTFVPVASDGMNATLTERCSQEFEGRQS
jgi:hypothetical protein